MAKPRKQFNAAQPAVVSVAPQSESVVIPLPRSVVSKTRIDLTEWLDQGIDAWVWSCAGQLRAMLQSGALRPATLINYELRGLKHFFRWLIVTRVAATPQDLTVAHVRMYLKWLKEHPSYRKPESQRTVYSKTKSVLVALGHRGLVCIAPEDYPRFQFRSAIKHSESAQPLSAGERARLADALRKDIIALHRGDYERPISTALGVYALALAMRTGINLSPLLELKRDALRPHPFLPRHGVLTGVKHRGRSTLAKPLRGSQEQVNLNSIPVDGMALFNKVLELTAEAQLDAPPDLRGLLWIYRAESYNNKNVTVLTSYTLARAVLAFVKAHDLRTDDGQPLNITMRRLRATMANRLWALSNGDIFTVASIMGNTVRVTDRHYLAITPDMQKQAVIVGEALPAMYSGADPDPEGVAVLSSLEKTPVGRCKDTLYGERAPKDGASHCIDFISCLTCRSFAVVGAQEDLHRLFSFQLFLFEQSGHPSSEWASYCHKLVAAINEFVAQHFERRLVDDAKARALSSPLRFWKRVSGGTAQKRPPAQQVELTPSDALAQPHAA